MDKSELLSSAPSKQHYAGFSIEPLQYIEANGIPFHEGSVIKYVSRWREKGGLDDLKKARFYIDRLIELEEGKEDKQKGSLVCEQCGMVGELDDSLWHCYKKAPGIEYNFCCGGHLDVWAKAHKEWVYKNE